MKECNKLPEREVILERVKDRVSELKEYTDLQELQNICEQQKSLSTKRILVFLDRLKSKCNLDVILFENLTTLSEKQKEPLIVDREGNNLYLGDKFKYGSAGDRGEITTRKGRVVVEWEDGSFEDLNTFYWPSFDSPFITKEYKVQNE